MLPETKQTRVLVNRLMAQGNFNPPPQAGGRLKLLRARAVVSIYERKSHDPPGIPANPH
jgi:hypothetical protein